MNEKNKWIEKWKYHLAGMALYGAFMDENDGPIAKAAKSWDIGKRVEDLLARMWADANPLPPGNPPAASAPATGGRR